MYNVSKFILSHPGGSMTLLDAAGTGKDFKDEFEAEDHSGKAKNMLK